LANRNDNLRILTPTEAREIGRKGGIKSGQARRAKANLKKAMQTLLGMDVASEKARKQLEELGLEPTNEMLLAVSTLQQATKGNQRATENVMKMVGVEKDKYDIAEQKERIKAMKLRNKEIEIMQGGGQVEDIIIINDISNQS
jgi:hypothetical protein